MADNRNPAAEASAGGALDSVLAGERDDSEDTLSLEHRQAQRLCNAYGLRPLVAHALVPHVFPKAVA